MVRSDPSYERIAFVASSSPEAAKARDALARRYGDVDPDTADVVVALGGDGLMLQTLHRFMQAGKPIYGMHRGTVGFLMNEFSDDKLKERLAAAKIAVIHPLLMCARDMQGKPSGGTAADFDRRQGASARTRRRRRAGVHAGGIHRL
jgi:NAD+ kinase